MKVKDSDAFLGLEDRDDLASSLHLDVKLLLATGIQPSSPGWVTSVVFQVCS